MYGCKASLLFEMGLREVSHALFNAHKLLEALLPMLGQRLQITKKSGSVSRVTAVV